MRKLIDVLADRLGVRKSALTNYLSTAHHRYKVFKIDKRQGNEKRTIAQPARTLKVIQREALALLDLEPSISERAVAYRKGISIRNNAECHLRSNYLLKMDFEKFFPSIKPEDLLNRLNYEALDIEDSNETKILMARLFFWQKNRNSELELSIGAPSSPSISNFIMNDFDQLTAEYANAKDITYTRYADDLVFSAKEPDLLKEMEQFVIQTVHESGSPALKINAAKTVHTSRKHNRHVTGVTLTPDFQLSLGRAVKRRLSSLIHKYKVDELSDEESLNELKGWLSHASHIEPEFIIRMIRKYGKETISALTRTSL